MSGGRATVGGRRGVELPRQAGDITATSAAGHALTDRFYIECKHHANMSVDRFILGTGKLAKFWDETSKQAVIYGRSPMLIARPNSFPTLVIVRQASMRMLCACDALRRAQMLPINLGSCDMFFFDELMQTRFNPMMRKRVRLHK